MWNKNAGVLGSLPSTADPDVWLAPNRSHIKWNVDASVNPLVSGSAIGGVLRNKHGNFMCLFSSPFPFIEINCVEILVIHRAISISLASEATKNAKIVLESDSAKCSVMVQQ